MVLSLLLIFSCTPDQEDSSNNILDKSDSGNSPVTVNMMVFANEGLMDNYESVLADFHESQDQIRVKLENVFGEDWSDYDLELRNRILNGNAPDIVDVSVIYRDSLISDGLLLDIMPFIIDSKIDLNLYFENQFEGLRRGSSLYGIPSGALLMAVYINKDLFRQAGIEIPSRDWENTWSWADFVRAAESIRALSSDDEEIYGMTMSFAIGWLIPFMMSNDADFLVHNDMRCREIDENSVEAIVNLRKLMFEDGVSPEMMRLISVQPFQHFFNGNLGIFIEGNWWLETVENSADFDWGVLPMPVLKKPATGLYVDSWAIAAGSKHPEAAFKVLEFFLDAEQQNTGIMKGIPALKSTAYETYSNLYPDLSKDEIDVWFNGIKYGSTPSYFYGWSDFLNKTTDVFRSYAFGELSDEEVMIQLCRIYNDSIQN